VARGRRRSRRSKKSSGESSSGTSVSRRSRSSSRRRTVDVDAWTARHLDELVDVLGLRFLDLSREEYRELVTKIVDLLYTGSSSIDVKTIARRFRRNLQQLYQFIAAALVEIREELSEEQLEFVVNNIGDAVLGLAPRLYRECVRRGRTDLVERLRAQWNASWVRNRHPVLPVECPRCGFNALMPDLTCLVCGATVSEEELKRHVGFENMLREFAETYPVEDVKRALKYGYVYLTSYGIKPPGGARDPIDIEVVLTRRERELLKRLLELRESREGAIRASSA